MGQELAVASGGGRCMIGGMKRIERGFFEVGVLDCARALVGCELRWGDCAGVVVETEAYAEHGDPACHTASRPSTRVFIRDFPAGSAYVYFNYGMHWMLNVLTKSEADGNGLVLIRAVRPTVGVEVMRARRVARMRREPPGHDRWLCSGPGKLAAALGVTGDDHGRDLCGAGECGFFRSAGGMPEVVATPRIGISKAVDFPWRFVAAGDRHASR